MVERKLYIETSPFRNGGKRFLFLHDLSSRCDKLNFPKFVHDVKDKSV